jgi:hypothetical protein
MQLMGLYFHRILPVQRQIPHGEGKAETRSFDCHMAQWIVADVRKGMDIWDCIAKNLFSCAQEETDPAASFQDISGLAVIPAGDERETGDMPAGPVYMTCRQSPLVFLQWASIV